MCMASEEDPMETYGTGNGLKTKPEERVSAYMCAFGR